MRSLSDVPTFVLRSMNEKDAHFEEDESIRGIRHLIGQLLCHTHAIRNLEIEEQFLSEVERDVDMYVGQVMEAKGEILYTQ